MEARSLTSAGILQNAIVRIDRDSPRRPKVSIVKGESVPTTSIRLFFGLTVGIDLQLHRHAEQIQVLRDLPDDAESLVVAQTINRVLGLELRRAG